MRRRRWKKVEEIRRKLFLLHFSCVVLEAVSIQLAFVRWESWHGSFIDEMFDEFHLSAMRN